MLSHRRPSVSQSEAIPYTNSPYHDPRPGTPSQLNVTTFKLPPTIDDSVIFHEENANGLPVETAKEHTSPRMFNDIV